LCEDHGIYGLIALGSLPQIGKIPWGFHSVVMEFFSAIVTTYDEDLRVQFRSNVGNKVPVLGTNDESNITLINASDFAVHESNIHSILLPVLLQMNQTFPQLQLPAMLRMNQTSL
jgi:hypothetical protein